MARTPGQEERRQGGANCLSTSVTNCRHQREHKLHLCVTEGRWSHPPTVLPRPSQTQDFSKQVKNFINRWTSRKSLLRPLAGGASQLEPFAEAVQEEGIWTLFASSGGRGGSMAQSVAAAPHGCSDISRSSPVPSSGGKSAVVGLRGTSSKQSMMSLQCSGLCRLCQLPWMEAAVRMLFVGRTRQKQ